MGALIFWNLLPLDGGLNPDHLRKLVGRSWKGFSFTSGGAREPESMQACVLPQTRSLNLVFPLMLRNNRELSVELASKATSAGDLVFYGVFPGVFNGCLALGAGERRKKLALFFWEYSGTRQAGQTIPERPKLHRIVPYHTISYCTILYYIILQLWWRLGGCVEARERYRHLRGHQQ